MAAKITSDFHFSPQLLLTHNCPMVPQSKQNLCLVDGLTMIKRLISVLLGFDLNGLSWSAELSLVNMFSGGKDADCECNGTGVMEYDDGTYLAGTWSHGKREGHFKFDTSHPKSTINYLEGVYKDDELCGKARVQLRDESWIEGYFKDSVLHGFCRYFDKEKHLTFIGMHRNGKPFGTCWKLIKGGGYIVGRVNEDGQLTGSDIAYLFPNIETAFVGQFVDGVLKEARVSKICDVILDYGCIKVPKFAEPTGPMYQRELSTSEFVTNSPLLKDPYEEKMVFVKQSLVEGAQEGLFSRQAVKANTIMAFYNGIRYL